MKEILEVVDFLLRFIFVDLIENGFLIIFTLLFIRSKLLAKSVLRITILTTIFSQFLYHHDSRFLLDRALLLGFIAISITICECVDVNKLHKVLSGVLLAMGTMVIIESLTVLPFILFLNLDMGSVQENIFILLPLSVPTRIIELFTLNLYYMKKGVKK